MTYFLRRNGFVKKTWLRILNLFMFLFIPFGLYETRKYYKINNCSISWLELVKEEFIIWLEGFKFGE